MRQRIEKIFSDQPTLDLTIKKFSIKHRDKILSIKNFSFFDSKEEAFEALAWSVSWSLWNDYNNKTAKNKDLKIPEPEYVGPNQKELEDALYKLMNEQEIRIIEVELTLNEKQ